MSTAVSDLLLKLRCLLVCYLQFWWWKIMYCVSKVTFSISVLSLFLLSLHRLHSLPNQLLPVHDVPNIQEYFKVPFFSSSCTLSAHTLHNIVLQH